MEFNKWRIWRQKVMRPEETIEKKFVEECSKIEVKAIKLEVQGDKGWPDRLCLLPNGITVFVEFKRPGGGEVSQHQKKKLNWLHTSKFRVLVADSWEQPLKYIEDIIYE